MNAELEARLREADAIIRDLAAASCWAHDDTRTDPYYCVSCGRDSDEPRWIDHLTSCPYRRARVYVEREAAREATE